jgi:hypothetical protein
MKSYFLLFLFLGGCASASRSGKVWSSGAETKGEIPAVVNAWLQWTPGPTLQARAVVSTASCPEILINQPTGSETLPAEKLPMKPRTAVTPGFPLLTCEAVLPSTAKTVRVGGSEVLLSVPERPLSRIVVIGDTGCRLKAPGNGKPGAYQACNDPLQWPFHKVAVAAAKLQPSLVIHLGDYNYREAPCPPGNGQCQGSAYGFDSPTWHEDFLTPAKPLLETAPWIFVRGNHESCSRAGAGWFQFLDPLPFQACRDVTESFTLKFGSHELVIMDVTDEKSMATELGKLKAGKSHRWLLLHRPFLTWNENPERPSAALLPKDVQKPGQISFSMSGHVHILSLNRFQDDRPPELIVGNGGSALDKKTDFLKPKPGDVFFRYNDFGFVSLAQQSVSAWLVQVHDTEGRVVKTCHLNESYRKKTRFACDEK